MRSDEWILDYDVFRVSTARKKFKNISVEMLENLMKSSALWACLNPESSVRLVVMGFSNGSSLRIGRFEILLSASSSQSYYECYIGLHLLHESLVGVREGWAVGGTPNSTRCAGTFVHPATLG